jgi:hypothetical protein
MATTAPPFIKGESLRLRRFATLEIPRSPATPFGSSIPLLTAAS